jgi:hypothetical protein
MALVAHILPTGLRRYAGRIRDISDERRAGDGYWVYLLGYCRADDCAHGHHVQSCVHNVHEDTITKCVEQMQRIKACDCSDCKGGK